MSPDSEHVPFDASAVVRAFDSLSVLPPREGAFLRHLLFHAIDDPALAADPSLTELLHAVPSALRALPIDALSRVETNSLPSSPALRSLCQIALRDRPFLLHFLTTIDDGASYRALPPSADEFGQDDDGMSWAEGEFE